MEYELDSEPLVAPQVVVHQGRPREVALIGEDAELLAKTKHVRNRSETMYQFYSRTGLGAAQIRTMTKAEISNFVAVVMDPEHPNVEDRESIYLFEITTKEMPQGGFMRRLLGKFKAFEPNDRPRQPLVIDTGC